MIFDDSDKKNFEKPIELDLDLVDPNSDLNTSLKIGNLLFAKLEEKEVFELVQDSGIIRKLNDRKFFDIDFSIEYLSDLDNRIYLKTKKGEVLVHIRLKFADFYIKKISENRKMIYIDWLLTQNVHLDSELHHKKLFKGQEYPGLNLFKEITIFIFMIHKKIQSYGVFNIPEYFHDAILFQKEFRFVDPEKEAYFKKLQVEFKNYTIRELSNLIHENKIFFKSNGNQFLWNHGEMLSTMNEFIYSSIFDDDYKTQYKKFFETNFEIRN